MFECGLAPPLSGWGTIACDCDCDCECDGDCECACAFAFACACGDERVCANWSSGLFAFEPRGCGVGLKPSPYPRSVLLAKVLS